jgi:hypothetical protein
MIKGPGGKRALSKKGHTTKGPYDKGTRDKMAYRLKEKHLKGIWSGLHIAFQVKPELLLLLNADLYDSMHFISNTNSSSFSGRWDFYSTAKEIYL